MEKGGGSLGCIVVYKSFWGGYLRLWENRRGPLFLCLLHFNDQVFWSILRRYIRCIPFSTPSPPRVHLCLIPYPHPPCLPVPIVMNLIYRSTICRCSVIIRWISAVSWPCGPACQEASRNQTFLEEHRRTQGKVRHSRGRSSQAEHSCSQPKYFIKLFK